MLVVELVLVFGVLGVLGVELFLGEDSFCTDGVGVEATDEFLEVL